MGQESFSLGIDVGGTAIKSVLLGPQSEVIEKFQTPSFAQNGTPEKVRETINGVVKHFKDENYSFSDIGVGCAGSIDADKGEIVNSPNFSGWANVPLEKWLEEDTKTPVHLDNDANCAALGEWSLGAGVGSRNMVLLTLGTGIGGGIILNSRLFRGSTGTAGELGHLSIESDGLKCACGNRGCFERYCSASALETRCPGYSAYRIFELAKEQGEPFRPAIDEFIMRLETGLVSIANVFDPDVIVLGGGLSERVEAYFPRIETHLKTCAFPRVGAHVRLAKAKFGGFGGAIGAGLLART